jgi:hypothetical protein
MLQHATCAIHRYIMRVALVLAVVLPIAPPGAGFAPTSLPPGLIRRGRDGNRNYAIFASLPVLRQRRSLDISPLLASSTSNRADELGVTTRPQWVPAWVPNWVFSASVSAQSSIALTLYLFHMLVLSKGGVPLPVQLIPNRSGHFQSIDLDNLAGCLVLFACAHFRKKCGQPPIPRVDSRQELPWCPDPNLRWPQLPLVVGMLCIAYFLSG